MHEQRASGTKLHYSRTQYSLCCFILWTQDEVRCDFRPNYVLHSTFLYSNQEAAYGLSFYKMERNLRKIRKSAVPAPVLLPHHSADYVIIFL